jgi:hypothetical protein
MTARQVALKMIQMHGENAPLMCRYHLERFTQGRLGREHWLKVLSEVLYLKELV